jgi:hypothetical protein
MSFGAQGIAFGAMVSGLVMLVVAIMVINATIGTRTAQYAAMLWRPLLSSLVMAAAVHLAVVSIDAPAIARLAACIAVGVLVYFSTLLALWHLAGRPAGIEHSVLGIIAASRRQR